MARLAPLTVALLIASPAWATPCPRPPAGRPCTQYRNAVDRKGGLADVLATGRNPRLLKAKTHVVDLDGDGACEFVVTAVVDADSAKITYVFGGYTRDYATIVGPYDLGPVEVVRLPNGRDALLDTSDDHLKLLTLAPGAKALSTLYETSTGDEPCDRVIEEACRQGDRRVLRGLLEPYGCTLDLPEGYTRLELPSLERRDEARPPRPTMAPAEVKALAERARTDHLRRSPADRDRADPCPTRVLDDTAGLGRALDQTAAAPCTALLARDGKEYAVWLALPGRAAHDLLRYRLGADRRLKGGAVPLTRASIARPAPKPGEWRITWHARAEGDRGDGRTRTRSETTVTVTPDWVVKDRRVALQPAQRDAITRLLPSVMPHAGTWQLTPTVDDEGSRDESLTIDFGGRVVGLHFVQGPRTRVPPRPVADLYRLVSGHPLPRVK